MKPNAIVLAIFLTFSVSGLNAQEADERVADLINKSDWFALEEEYPRLRDNIRLAALKRFADALICTHFNQPEKALMLIDSLLVYHQKELGFYNIGNMVLLKSAILGKQGLYAQSADVMNDFLHQISASFPKEDFPDHLFTARLYDEIRNEQPPEIIRPDADTEIPASIEKVGKDGAMIFVPVTIHGKEHRFIFDTGANSTFVSERFAHEIGLRIVRESVPVAGIETGMGKIGTTDSIVIGDIIFKHPLIVVSMPNRTVDTLFQLDAVLGLDFIKRTGETRIYPGEGKMVFPKNRTPLPKTGRNLFLSGNGQLYLKAFSGKERLIFHFDTGNTTGNLFDTYYRKHKEEIDGCGIKDTVRVGGFGGIRYLNGFRLSRVSLTTGCMTVDLNNIPVSVDKFSDVQQNEDGALGMDFIGLFEKVIINFDEMFVEVE
ncbi:MAG: retroviral-like aspartic protease family protein [Bacteroidales bacterium]|jgi:hypothetical protein|nr:retroviral-like aspartic protease family protein [Bacteroidales bacterium]